MKRESKNRPRRRLRKQTKQKKHGHSTRDKEYRLLVKEQG